MKNKPLTSLSPKELEPKKRAHQKANLERLDDLNAARVSMGWTWGELSRQLGVTTKTMSLWKQAKTSVPESAVRLAELRVKVRDLQK